MKPINQPLPYRLTLYFPERLFGIVEPFLGPSYTLVYADGMFNGNEEDIDIVTIYGEEDALTDIGADVMCELFMAGEQAVLIVIEATPGVGLVTLPVGYFTALGL